MKTPFPSLTPIFRALRIYASLVFVLLAVSPSLLFAQEEKPADPARPSEEQGPFEVTPASNPKFFTGYFDDRVKGQVAVQMEKQGDLAVIDGDIVLGTETELKNSTSAKGLTDVNAKLWKQAHVAYVVASDFPNRNAVLKAFDEYNTRTKIRFVARTTEPDYLEFTVIDNPNIGGQSRLGRKGGKQPLWMNQNTSKWTTGTVVHELGHALGLMHEQCRNDRDNHVEIVWASIMDGYKPQFQQLSNGRDLQPYDFESVLHYPKNAFGVGGAVTIKPKGFFGSIGQRSRLSDGDIKSLHELYKNEIQP